MRRLLAFLRDLRESAFARPGRATLALLAIFTGSFALAVLAGVLRGLDRRARDIEADFGANAFVITPAGAESRSAREIPAEALDRLRPAAPRLLAAGVRGSRAPTRAGELQLSVAHADPELGSIRPFALREGRLLDDLDSRDRSRVAVISEGLRQRLSLRLGGTVYLGAEPFEIVGIAEFPSAAVPGATLDPALGVWVPRDTPAYWMVGDPPSSGFHALWVRHDGLAREAAVALTRDLLNGNGLEASGFTWITADHVLEPLRKWRHMIRLTAGSVALFCLLLGGATLMSLMVANVQERVPEIGLRRSLGATRGSIARLFLCEALLLTTIASIAGGVAAAPWGQLPWVRQAGLPYAVDAYSLVVPIACSVLLGALFSAGPAWRASRIQPSEALRAD